MERTEIDIIKQMPIADFLARLGHEPVRRSGNELWYRAPYRNERTPSFRVNVPMFWYETDFKEIQEGCVTFAWRNGLTQPAINAAVANNAKIMMCPGDYCYFDYLSVHVSGCTACRLGQRTVTAKEAFLVCIENSYERNFRQVESFS